MSPSDRIRSLVAAGTVSAQEGERLLRALDAAPVAGSGWRSLDPFVRVGGGTLATIGAAVSALGVATSRFGARFDGFIDCHVARGHVVSLPTALVDQAVDWLVPALLFFAYARACTRNVRAIDFVGFVGVARAPLLLTAVVGAMIAPTSLAEALRLTSSMVAIVATGVVTLAALITLLYRGWKGASGLRGGKLVLGFVGLVFACEIATKVLLFVLS